MKISEAKRQVMLQQGDVYKRQMYTSGDTDRPLTGPEDRIEVGCVDYEAYDQKADFLYTKTDLRLFNTMDGYVIEDAGGEVFAWMYPTIHGNDLMVQMYGTEQYHSIRMVEDLSLIHI